MSALDRPSYEYALVSLTSSKKDVARASYQSKFSQDIPHEKSMSSKIVTSKRLSKTFYDKPCSVLAKDLLGKLLCRRLTAEKSSKDIVLKGRIVETEMYPGNVDKASHSANNRRTARNGAMFMDPGTAYVYITYGMYFCFNISAKEPGGAILIRALEPTEGLEKMRELRPKGKKARELKDTDLCSGPSKLCQSLNISKESDNEKDMTTESAEIWVEEAPDLIPDQIFTSTRIGIEGAGEHYANLPYRFYEKDNPHVSVLDKKDKAEKKRKLQEERAEKAKAKKKRVSPEKKPA